MNRLQGIIPMHSYHIDRCSPLSRMTCYRFPTPVVIVFVSYAIELQCWLSLIVWTHWQLRVVGAAQDISIRILYYQLYIFPSNQDFQVGTFSYFLCISYISPNNPIQYIMTQSPQFPSHLFPDRVQPDHTHESYGAEVLAPINESRSPQTPFNISPICGSIDLPGRFFHPPSCPKTL